MLSSRRWFKDSLAFGCTACGRCCKGKTNVFINSSEGVALAEYLNISLMDFYRRYTYEKETANGDLLVSLKSSDSSAACVFLKDNKCSVYDVRPTACRTYPFWPQLVMGQEEWATEGVARCEGINSTAPDAAVPAEAVLRNVIITQVHDRGLGPDYEHDDAVDYLQESLAVSPTMLQDFEDEFFATHRSEVVYQSADYRVVDAIMPAPASGPNDAPKMVPTAAHPVGLAPSSAADNMRGNSLHLGTHDNVNDGNDDDDDDGGAPTELVTRRRLVPSAGAEPYVELVLDALGQPRVGMLLSPSHRVLGAVAAFVAQEKGLGPAAGRGRMAVVGGPGAVLATYLHAHGAADRVDLFESNTELATIAETFFGATFADDDDDADDGAGEGRGGVYLAPLKDVGKGGVDYAAILLDRPDLFKKDKFKWASLAKPLQRCGVVAVGMRGTVEEVRGPGFTPHYCITLLYQPYCSPYITLIKRVLRPLSHHDLAPT